MWKCIQCNEENEDKIEFCQNCGTSSKSSYQPSGKHPGIPSMFLLTVLGSIAGGVAGAIGILLMFTAIIETFGRGNAISSIAIIICLGIIVPIMMGYLTSYFTSYNSRNPKISSYFGIMSGIMAIVVMIITHMNILDFSLVEWMRLDWGTPTGRPVKISDISGYFVLAFFHLIPMALTILSSSLISNSKASEPFCENCNRRCPEKSVGGKMNEKKLESFITKKLFNSIIKPNIKYLQSSKSSWFKIKVHLCRLCDSTGFLTLEYHWSVKQKDGKVEDKSRTLITQYILNAEQVKNLKNIQTNHIDSENIKYSESTQKNQSQSSESSIKEVPTKPIKNRLPEEIECPHCGVELELEEKERKEFKFKCPDCNKVVDMTDKQNLKL